MDYRQQLIRTTRDAAKGFVKNMRAIPADKLNWKVLDAGRSPMDLFQEVAQSPTYVIPILENRACPPWDPETFGALTAERQSWTTLDQCEAKLNESLDKWEACVRAFPEAEMPEEIDLPFVEGLRQSFADIMNYPYWNLSYHLGQICFIQTLYGDARMH
jgi:hypothetical protein